MITNNYNLPKALYRAVCLDTHRAGGDFSTTQLLKSPREFWLSARHSSDQDAINRLWALMGTASHAVAERGEAENSLVEQYMKMEFNGVTLTGSLDLYEDGIIWDYKNVSVNKLFYFNNQSKTTLTAQANIYAYMFKKLFGFEVKGLKDLFIFRDWVKAKAMFDSSYPDYQAQVVDLPLYEEHQQKELILSRIDRLMKYKDTLDNELPECSKEYRWANPPIYKVYKEGNKKAVSGGANFSTCLEAKCFLDSLDPKYKYRIEAIEGNEWKRCEYCEGREFCNQTQYIESEWRKPHKDLKVNLSYEDFKKEIELW